jgi:hypothetical protein
MYLAVIFFASMEERYGAVIIEVLLSYDGFQLLGNARTHKNSMRIFWIYL